MNMEKKKALEVYELKSFGCVSIFFPSCVTFIWFLVKAYSACGERRRT